MALISCPDCKKEISDQATACPNCGHPIALQQPNLSYATQNASVQPKKKKKVVKIILLIFSVIVLVIVGLYFLLMYIDNQILYDYEEIARDCVIDLRDMLKDPNSLVIYDDVTVLVVTGLEADSDGVYVITPLIPRSGVYVYIDYGATNSFGGSTRSVAMYKNGVYIGNLEDCIGLSFDESIKKLGNEKRREIDLLEAQEPYLVYKAGITEGLNYNILYANVEKNKIMNLIN